MLLKVVAFTVIIRKAMIKTMVSSSSTNIFITIFIQLFQNRRTAYYHYKYFEQS